jgi:hypothetical protein
MARAPPGAAALRGTPVAVDRGMPRTTERYSIDLAASVLTDPDGPHTAARVQNVSTRGLALSQLPRPIARETPIWIEIPKADGRGRVGFLGRVRWTRDDSAGVEIEAMLPHHRLRLSSILEELSTSPGAVGR